MNYSDLPGKVNRPGTIKPSLYKGNDLLLTAGFIRPSGRGLISYLPLGMRVLRNLKRIISEEMEALGGMEIAAPLVASESLWEVTGRNESSSVEFARFTDRQGRKMVLAPTHEEAITDLIKEDIRSHKDLPLFVFQNQIKFRDEIRPRGYLIRSREFLMHDGYSFHRNYTELNNFFPKIFAAYERVLKRCSVPYITSEADPGFMRGSRSYEFTMPHEYGKDVVVKCPQCGYRANRNIARCEKPTRSEALKEMEERACDALIQKGRKERPDEYARCHIFRGERRYIMAVYRSDFSLSVDKIKKMTGEDELIPATEEEIRGLGIDPKSVSPFNNSACLIVVDDSVTDTSNLIMPSGVEGFCFTGVNFGRDFDAHKTGDIVKAGESNICRICGTNLQTIRGIELAHIFKLDDFYCRKFSLSFQDEDNKIKTPFMGSYGIGLGRLLFAAAESNNDEKGLLWPAEIAPFRYFIMGIGKSPSVRDRVYELAEKLGNQVLVDDRKEGIGVKLRDCDIMGIPCRIIISNRFLEKGEVEVYTRRDRAISYVSYTELLPRLQEWEREQGLRT